MMRSYDAIAAIVAITLQLYVAVAVRIAVGSRDEIATRSKAFALLAASPIFLGCMVVVYVGYRFYTYDGIVMGGIWWALALGDFVGGMIVLRPHRHSALRPAIFAAICGANIIFVFVHPDPKIIGLAIPILMVAGFAILKPGWFKHQ